MIELPKQLENKSLRFNKLIENQKLPLEAKWQNEKNYPCYAPKFRHYLKLAAGYGIVCGFGGLVVIDIDKKSPHFKEALEAASALPETFTVTTANKGKHFYFFCPDLKKGMRLREEVGEVRAKGMFVVGPGSKVQGKKYTVLKNVPVATIKKADIEKAFEKWLPTLYVESHGVDAKPGPTDKTRSGREFAQVCKLIREGKTKEQVFKEMQLYAKWSQGHPQYREITYQNAKAATEQNIGGVCHAPDEQELAFLSDPKIFETITEDEFDKKIVEEYAARKTTFLVACCCLVENCNPESSNLMIHSESGSGKDYVTKNVLSIFPGENSANPMYIKRTRIGPTTFTYWHNAKFEPDWTWNKKMFYGEDMSNTVLNCEVMKTMASGGSKSTITIKQRTYDIIVNGKPAIFITIAAANPEKETIRRYPILSLDESVNQTKAIVKRQLEAAEKGELMEYDPLITSALSKLKRVRVRIPFASKLQDHIPIDHIIMRTNNNRFMDYIRASSALHQFQREIDEEGYLIATGQDYDIAREAILKTASNQKMIPLTKDQKRILGALKELGEGMYEIKSISAKVPISERWVRTQLNILLDYGFVKKDKKRNEETKKDIMVYSALKFSNLKLPTWKEITAQCRNRSKPTTSSNTTITSKHSKTKHSPDTGKTEVLNALNVLHGEQSLKKEVFE